MPAVNLNRIYMLRARERRPILNGVNVPDTAGAYQRATMPALRARLAISENDARLKQDDIHRKYQGIATGIRAFGNALDTTSRYMAEMERARDRQRATTLRDLFNDYELNMLKKRGEIANAERTRAAGGDGTYTTGGPLAAAIEAHNAWRESKQADYDALDEQGKKEFDFRMEKVRLELEANAAEKQAEQQQKHAAQSINDSVKTHEAKIRTLYDPSDAAGFSDALPEMLEAEKFAWRFARGLIDAAGNARPGREETDEDRAAWDVEQRRICDSVQLERLQHLANRYIETGDSTCLNELKAWGGEKVEGECVLPPDDVTALQDDAKRQKVRELAADAEDKRAQKIQQDDAEKAAAAGVQFNKSLEDANKAISGGGVDGAKVAKAALDAGYDTATAMAAGITDAGRRQAFMAKVEDSHQKAVIHYADELRAQVAFGNLSQTDYEAARAQTENLLEDMGEAVRGPLLEKMDRAIATQEANAFLEEYMKTQPDPYFGGTVTPEQKLEGARMLEMLRNKPNGMTKTIICNQLFGATGGGTRGGTGTGRVKDFTQADVSGLLAQGVPPIDVLDMMNQARGAGGMKGDAYMKGLDLCKARMTFNDAVGNQARDYVASIYGAVNEAFGTTLGNYIRVGNDGIPLVDANGKPILNGDGDKKYTTHLLKKGSLIGQSDVVMASYVGAADMHDRLTIIGDTLREAFAYGMQYVVSRKNGFVKRGEPMTPYAIRQELADLFRNELFTSDAGMALSNEFLEQNMDTARIHMAQYGIPRARVEAAREEAIQSHMWRGAVQPEKTEEE